MRTASPRWGVPSPLLASQKYEPVSSLDTIGTPDHTKNPVLQIELIFYYSEGIYKKRYTN